MMVDVRRGDRGPPPFHVEGDAVEVVHRSKYLEVHVSCDFMKVHQHLYFLRRHSRLEPAQRSWQACASVWWRTHSKV